MQVLVLFIGSWGGFGACLGVVLTLISRVFGDWCLWLAYWFYGRYDGVLARARVRARVYYSVWHSLSLLALSGLLGMLRCAKSYCTWHSLGTHLALSVGTL